MLRYCKRENGVSATRTQATNDFSQGGMARNIIHMAVPMTVAQLINILYNVVDRMYLGRLPGHLALTGLGLCLPIISILMGFANLCGMGGAPLCSIHRGRGETDEAERIMGNSFTLLLLFGLSLTGLCLAFRRPILYLFGASDLTFPYANDYLTIYILGTVFVMVGLGMNPFINSQGFSRMGMMTVTVGAVVNIVLDPIFIFGMGMGVRGAALATVISQGCSAVWVLRFLTGRRAILRLRLSALRLHAGRVKRILSLGSSGFAMSMTNSLVQVLCNATLQAWGGELYVGVMTVINSIREIANVPVSGLTSAAQPVMGYNYGAKLYRRVREGIRFTSIACFAILAVIWLILLLFPEFFIRLFNEDPELIAACVPSMHLYFFGFFMMAGQSAGQSAAVALGRSRQAVFFSLLRKAFIVIPLTLILPYCWNLGVTGVFIAEPISNFIGGGACFITMLLTIWRELCRREREEQAAHA